MGAVAVTLAVALLVGALLVWAVSTEGPWRPFRPEPVGRANLAVELRATRTGRYELVVVNDGPGPAVDVKVHAPHGMGRARSTTIVRSALPAQISHLRPGARRCFRLFTAGERMFVSTVLVEWADRDGPRGERFEIRA